MKEKCTHCKGTGQVDDGKRRMDYQPALFLVAQEICSLDMTDGFCTPRNRDACECWSKAEKLMDSSGFSAKALVWILQHRKRIEEEATR